MKEAKSKLVLLRNIAAVDNPLIADTSLYKSTLPSGTANISSSDKVSLVIRGIAYDGAVADDTFTVKLWGFRDSVFIAEYIGEVVMTVGTSAIAVDPITGTAITGGLFVDSMAVTDNWTPASSGGVLISVGADNGNNRMQSLFVDTMGCSYIYPELTASSGSGKIKLIYSYMNS